VDGVIGESGEVEVDREFEVLEGEPKLGTNSRITEVKGFKFVKLICLFPGV